MKYQRSDRIRILLPLALAALFPLVQVVTSAATSFFAGIALPPIEAGQLVQTPEYLLSVTAISQILALALIATLGSSIFVPSAHGRSGQLRMTLILTVPVVLLTLGVQLFEAGLLALMEVDLGRYEEIADLILQADIWIVIVTVALVPGLCEELVFREVIQPAATHTLGAVYGILYTSALFSVVHFIPVQMLAAFIFGLVFGYIRFRSGSVYPAIVAHVIANAIVIVLGRLGAAMTEVDPRAVHVDTGYRALLVVLALGIVLAVSGVLVFERIVRQRAPR